MATDYSKLKNAELEVLLKERSLPHTGKKAEMVARLQESDKASTKTLSSAPAATSAAAAPTASKAEDEISWDEDEPGTATSGPAAAAVAAGGQVRAKNPAAVPNQASAIDPAKTSDLSAAKGSSAAATHTSLKATAATPSTEIDVAKTEAEKKEAKQREEEQFSAHIAPTSLEAELAKRRARAAKFGIQESDSKAEEAAKSLERAKRFGLSSADGSGAVNAGSAISKLDGALPERRARRGKRGSDAMLDTEAAGAGADYEDAGLKRRKFGRGGGRGASAAGAGGRGGSAAGQKKDAGSGPTWMSDADRQKAEARKNKWAVPAS